MSTVTYTPARNTLEDEDRRPYTIIRSEDWNGNFRMLGRQGNNIDSYLSKLSPYLGSFDDTQLNIISTMLNTLVLKENISDSNLLCSTILYDSASGVITFKNRSGGTMATIDLNIEKIPVSIQVLYRTAGWYIVITNTDGSETSCPVGELFKPITFQDSTRIDFTETTLSSGAKTVTADIKSHSIGYDQLATEPFAEIRTAVSATAADKAAADASADAADLSAGSAATSASSAAESASDAAASAESVASMATLSQSWAVGGTGTRTGEDTNNAKYWCEQAAAIVDVHFVSYAVSQSLTGTEKQMARNNINAEQKLFVCEPYQTTYQEIITALNADRYLIVIGSDGKTYYCTCNKNIETGAPICFSYTDVTDYAYSTPYDLIATETYVCKSNNTWLKYGRDSFGAFVPVRTSTSAATATGFKAYHLSALPSNPETNAIYFIDEE